LLRGWVGPDTYHGSDLMRGGERLRQKQWDTEKEGKDCSHCYGEKKGTTNHRKPRFYNRNVAAEPVCGREGQGRGEQAAITKEMSTSFGRRSQKELCQGTKSVYEPRTPGKGNTNLLYSVKKVEAPFDKGRGRGPVGLKYQDPS